MISHLSATLLLAAAVFALTADAFNILPKAQAPNVGAVASGHVICTLEYNPVCCLKDGVRSPQSNPCFCTANGGTITGYGPVCALRREAEDVAHASACTLEYNPVCCLTHGIRWNAPNPCVCKESGGTVTGSGPYCASRREAEDVVHARPCTLEYNPVCCLTNGIHSIAPNPCFCKANGGTVTGPGPMCPFRR